MIRFLDERAVDGPKRTSSRISRISWMSSQDLLLYLVELFSLGQIEPQSAQPPGRETADLFFDDS